MRNPFDSSDALARQVAAEQVRAHYAQIPAMAAAPTLGGLFTAWVLWGAVDRRVLVAGMLVVTMLSAARLLLYRHFFRLPAARCGEVRWRVLAVLGAGLSGCVWGSAAPLLYPSIAVVAGYDVFLVVLLTLLPIVPVAALAVYMPAFYAYFVPCILPFVATLAWQGSEPERMSALLITMMGGAMLTFARRYGASLEEAIRLRVALLRQSEELQAAVTHKSQFIAAASHDLRQPVQAMGLFLAALRAEGGGSTDSRLVDHLDASLRNLRGMLTNMLDFSRLDAEMLSPQLQVVPVDALLDKLLAEHLPLAADGRLALRRCGAAGAQVHADPALLERMLRNLLSNALKYTRRGGLALVCRRRGPAVWLQVVDTGIGIHPAHVGRVFEAFARIADPARGDVDGLGLGLAITQRMAALQGLQLRLHSRPGRGSVFSIVLPAVDGGPPAADPAVLPAPPAPAAAADAPARLVLIVDDDPAVAAATSALVRAWGHRTLVAHGHDDALAAVTTSGAGPDLLIADLRLAGGRSGLALASALQHRHGRPMPVIVITGDTAPDRLREAHAAGHLLLHKPVDPQRLRACMAAAWVPAVPPPAG